MAGQRVICGPFELDPGTQVVHRGGEALPLGLRAVLLLEALFRRPGEVLTKSELMDAAWAGAAVEESNLTVQIAALRKALGPAPGGSDWIVTIPRVGYRFIGVPAASEPPQARRTAQSIAVLPFASLSTDPDQSFFADGLAEEIITTLSKVSGLLVISRSSSFVYKGGAVDVRKAATELAVDHVLTGSVRRSGNRVRMSVQLAGAETGGHLWAESYDRELTDVFAIQEQVAREVVAALKVKLSSAESERLGEGKSRNLEALQWYARARDLADGTTLNRAIFESATAAYQRAIDLDPSYAVAYSGLAGIRVLDYVNRWTEHADDALVEARRLIEIALRLGPDEARPHAAAAIISMMENDTAQMAREVEATLAIDPNFAQAHNLRGNFLVAAGDPLAAIPHFELSVRLESAAHHYPIHHLAGAYLIAGRYETAAALYRQRILLVPGTDMSRAMLCSALGHLGRLDEVETVWRELIAITPNYALAGRLKRGLPLRPADEERVIEGWRKAGLQAHLDAEANRGTDP